MRAETRKLRHRFHNDDRDRDPIGGSRRSRCRLSPSLTRVYGPADRNLEDRVMPPRWKTRAAVQVVQLDYDKTPKERPVRLTGPAPLVGEPLRVGMSDVEIEEPQSVRAKSTRNSERRAHRVRRWP